MFGHRHHHDTCQESFSLIKDLKIPLLSKLSVLAATTPSFPKFLLIATFIWSQIQLFFVISRSASLSLLEDEHNFASQVLDRIDDNFFFGNIFDFPNYPRLTTAMLVITLLYLGLTTLGFVYVMLALKNRAPFFGFVQRILKILIDVHPHVLFYPIHINMIKLLYKSIDQGEDDKLQLPAKIFSLVVLIYNLFFTLTLTIWFSINTKTKHPFSSKTNLINTLDLAGKIIVSFLWNQGNLDNGTSIVLMIGIILYCRCRNWILFRYLAYYRVYALKIATISHAILSSYMWALGFGRVFYLARNEWNQYNVTMLFWVIFGPIFIKLWSVHGEGIRVKVLLKPNCVKNTYHLLHYYEICKSFVDFGLTGLTKGRIKRNYMDFVSSLIVSEGAGKILKEVNQDWNTAKQKSVNQYFLKKSMEMINGYLKKSSERLWLAKLTLARYYSKYEAHYAQANHLIDGGLDENIFVKNSYLYIKVKILHKLQREQADQEDIQGGRGSLLKKQELNVGEFIRIQEMFKKIQKDFIRSVSLHIEFWKNFQLPKPNLLKLLNLAQTARHRSGKLNYISQAAQLFAQHNFPEPLLICGLYFHFFQYKMAVAQTLIHEFFQLEQKNKDKHDHHNPIGGIETIGNQQHRFTSEAIYFVVSPAQNSLGKILDCSGRVGSVLGIPKDLLVGQSLNTLIPPSFAKYHDNFLRAQQQSSSLSVMNKTRDVTTLMKDGYIAPAYLHVALTHVRNYELCYYALLEPIKDDTRIVTIANNGLMSACSRSFAEDLGIIDYSDKDSLNIWEICPDFGNITSPAKRKLGSVLKTIRNFKRTSLGQAQLKNFSNVFAKTSSILSEETHHHLDEKHPEEDEVKGSHVRTISVKESELAFYPCWYRTPHEREGVEPLIYQAQIRKFEVTGVEMMELKMKKVSNFSFVPPVVLKQNDLKSLKSTFFHSPKTTFMMDLQVPPPLNTMRTENGALISPLSLSSSRGLLKSPRLGGLFLKDSLTPSMNYDTLETPQLTLSLRHVMR